MNTSRLANVIFDKGKKITQTHYQSICESIDNDCFTLDEYVLDYKVKENFVGKVPYQLKDGTKILVSEKFIIALNNIDIDKNQLEKYIQENYSNFKKITEVIVNGNS
jgi:hypothetical protein